MKKLFFVLFLAFGFSNTFGQYFQTGQDPASIRWRQINTVNFQLIYPDYFENQAKKLVSILEEVYRYGGYSLNYKPKKISVILHTQTVKSNGLVAWAPKRSEFYTTPHQDIYPQDWLEQLAIHEFRHVVQVDKINSYLPFLIKAILGEQGTALVFGAYLPWWFIEGDAVVTETVLSDYGRGRLPSFLMEHKAQVIEKGVYKYDKAYNGSFKDYVPGHYNLGYYLVGETRKKYGQGVWDSVLTRVGKSPLSFNPFNHALKKTTGFKKVKLYNSLFDSLKTEWLTDDKRYVNQNLKVISPENKVFTNYDYGHFLNDSIRIAYRTSLNKNPAFVAIGNNKKEKVIFTPGDVFDQSVSYRDEFIVWSEQLPDRRWAHSGKSLLRIYNTSTSKITEILPEFKALSPVLSPEKDKVAVIESDFQNNFYLAVYSFPEKKRIFSIQTKGNNYLFSPCWLNSNEIALIVLYPEGKRIEVADIKTNEFKVLTNNNLGEIKNLMFSGNELFFISGYSGKDALYSYNFKDSSVYLLNEPRFGFSHPVYSAKNSEILVGDYTSDGYRLVKLDAKDLKKYPLSDVKKVNYKLADALTLHEKGIPEFSLKDTNHYESRKYSKLLNLFNYHSWAPMYINADTYEFSPGASLMSQNKLGTAETVLGYKWDYTEKTGRYYAKYVFKGWYPVFNFELNSGKNASQYNLITQTKNSKGEIIKSDTTLTRYSYNSTGLYSEVYLPLNLSKGKYNRFLQPIFRYSLTQYKHNSTTPESFFKGNLQSALYRLYFSQYLNRSYQDVYPNFGFIADLSYRNSPFGKNDMGSVSSAQTTVYMPGLLANHGIKVYSGIQKKKIPGKYNFSEVVRYPRGWGKINTNEMLSLSADYKMPLFNPDWSIGGVTYLKRVNASFFVDYAALEGYIFKDNKVAGTFSKNLSSFGIEITGNVHFLRFYAPVDIGFRSSFIPDTKKFYFDFLFSIDFNSL